MTADRFVAPDDPLAKAVSIVQMLVLKYHIIPKRKKK